MTMPIRSVYIATIAIQWAAWAFALFAGLINSWERDKEARLMGRPLLIVAIVLLPVFVINSILLTAAYE